MHRQPSEPAAETAYVIMSDKSPDSPTGPKKVDSVPKIDAEAYERGTRETIAFDHGFIVVPPDEVRETLGHIPPGLFPNQ